METKTNQGTGIVLNRMYVGDYLSSNLGHEIINLYKADNGGHYLYLNSTGDFVKAHQGKIDYMLMVKYFCKGEVEVIALATGLKDVYDASVDSSAEKFAENDKLFTQQLEYIKGQGGITYGGDESGKGVSILDIFNASEQQNVFITYKANKVYRPLNEKRIFIRFQVDDQTKEEAKRIHFNEPSHVVIELEGYKQAKASLKQYIYAEGTYSGDQNKVDVEKKQRDYCQIVEKIIQNSDLWERKDVDNAVKQVTSADINNFTSREISLFDICKIQNSENDFSNALQYFMEKYPAIWKAFFKQYGIDLGDGYKVSREEDVKIKSTTNKNSKNNDGETDQKSARREISGRIDLLIRDNKNQNIIVIENKIKSDINTIESDKKKEEQAIEITQDSSEQAEQSQTRTQLNRYVEYIKWLISPADTEKEEKKDAGKKPHYFILAPNYNIPSDTMDDLYKVITYGDLYNFLKIRSAVKEDPNFKAFFEAMHRHTHENVNDYLYYEMQEKFFNRIKQLKK